MGPATGPDAATRALLLHLTRPVLEPSDIPGIQTLAQHLSAAGWAWLRDQTIHMRTTPWLTAHATALDLPMPVACREALDRANLEAMQRTLHCDQLRQQLADALRGHDAPLLLIKGRAVELRVYPQGTLRPAVDVDVLVRPGCTAQVGQILARAGLQARPQKHRHERTWSPASGPASIDVHEALVDPLRFPTLGAGPERQALFDRAQPGAEGLQTLHPLDQTAHLLLHACTSLYGDLRHLADTARWLAVVQPDPPALAARLQRWRAVRAGRAALAAVQWFDPKGAGLLAADTLALLGRTDAASAGFAVIARQILRQSRWLEAIGLLAHVEHPARYAWRRWRAP